MLGMLLDALRDLISGVFDWLAESADQPGFWPGVLVGVVVLAVIGFLGRLQAWWNQAQAPLGPQTVTVKHKTDKSPAQVMLSGCLTTFLLVVGFSCVIGLALEMLIPGTMPSILDGVGRVFRWVGESLESP